MARAERRIFSYAEHTLYRTLYLSPRHNTEQKFRGILKRCMATNNANIFIQNASESVFVSPQAFMRAKALPPENQEKFIALTAQAMKKAERVTVTIPTFNFSRN